MDQQCRLLALALTELDAATPRYATVKYEEALNWSSVISKLREIAAAEGLCWRRRDFYVVEFRSKLKPDIDNIRLFQLDKESHREATESGGLLKYWFGKPDEERRNLATCRYDGSLPVQITDSFRCMEGQGRCRKRWSRSMAQTSARGDSKNV